MHRIRATVMLLAAAVSCRPSAPRVPELVLSVPHDVETLDPHARDRTADAVVAAHLYDGLVALDREMGVRPALAESWSSPDDLTWVFTLRDGPSFPGGRPVVADDVVATLERLKSRADLEFGLYAAGIESARARDARTVVLRTKSPSAILLNKLASIAIVPRGAGSSLATRPEGTGPYRLAAFGARVLRLVRNETWWGPKPAARDVTILLGRSAAEAAEDVASGRSSVGQCSTRAAAAIAGRQPGVTLVRRAGLGVKYLGFDVAGGEPPGGCDPARPFRSRLVREAVSRAIDRSALVESLPVFARPATRLIPAGVFGHDPREKGASFDVAGARELLSRAGFRSGLDATLDTRRGGLPMASRIAELLAPAGFRVRAVEHPEAEFFDRARKGELGFFFSAFVCASGDASDLWEAGFHSVDPERGRGSSNWGRWSDPALDAAIERTAGMLDPEARREALWEIGRKADAELVWIPLYGDENVWAVREPFRLRPRANGYLLAAEIELAGR